MPHTHLVCVVKDVLHKASILCVIKYTSTQSLGKRQAAKAAQFPLKYLFSLCLQWQKVINWQPDWIRDLRWIRPISLLTMTQKVCRTQRATVSTLREAAARNQLHWRRESQISSLAEWRWWIYIGVRTLPNAWRIPAFFYNLVQCFTSVSFDCSVPHLGHK